MNQKRPDGLISLAEANRKTGALLTSRRIQRAAYRGGANARRTHRSLHFALGDGRIIWLNDQLHVDYPVAGAGRVSGRKSSTPSARRPPSALFHACRL